MGRRRRRHCVTHSHPKLKRPVSRARVERELNVLAREAGLPTPCRVAWTQGLERTHRRNVRRYAQVYSTARPPKFELAPQTVYLPAKHRRALLAHEVGHVLAPQGGEDDADLAAREVLGVRIGYDRRFPGKGLQVARNPDVRIRELQRRLGHGDPTAYRPLIDLAVRAGQPGLVYWAMDFAPDEGELRWAANRYWHARWALSGPPEMNPPPRLRRVCADCELVLEEGDPGAPVSHGLCRMCYEIRREELRRMREAREGGGEEPQKNPRRTEGRLRQALRRWQQSQDPEALKALLAAARRAGPEAYYRALLESGQTNEWRLRLLARARGPEWGVVTEIVGPTRPAPGWGASRSPVALILDIVRRTGRDLYDEDPLMWRATGPVYHLLAQDVNDRLLGRTPGFIPAAEIAERYAAWAAVNTALAALSQAQAVSRVEGSHLPGVASRSGDLSARTYMRRARQWHSVLARFGAYLWDAGAFPEVKEIPRRWVDEAEAAVEDYVRRGVVLSGQSEEQDFQDRFNATRDELEEIAMERAGEWDMFSWPPEQVDAIYRNGTWYAVGRPVLDVTAQIYGDYLVAALLAYLRNEPMPEPPLSPEVQLAAEGNPRRRPRRNPWKTPPPCAPSETTHGPVDMRQLRGERVRVHVNLHNGCYVVGHGGRVAGYAKTLMLRGARPRVSHAGWQRCNTTKTRNVHAYLTGDLLPAKQKRGRGWRKITYNCKEAGPHFHYEDGTIFEGAQEVLFLRRGNKAEVWARGPAPAQRNPGCGCRWPGGLCRCGAVQRWWRGPAPGCYDA